MLRLTTSKARPFSKTSHRQGTMWHGPAPCRVFWTMCFYVVFLISLIASQGPFQRRVTHRLGHMACCRYTPTKHTFHEWPRTLLLRLWFLNQTSLVFNKLNNQWSKVHFCSDHRQTEIHKRYSWPSLFLEATIFLWKYFVNSSARPRVEEERRLVPASVLPTSSSITSAPNTPPVQMHHHHIHHHHHQCTTTTSTTSTTSAHATGPPRQCTINADGQSLGIAHQAHHHQWTNTNFTNTSAPLTSAPALPPSDEEKNALELQNKFRLISAYRK